MSGYKTDSEAIVKVKAALGEIISDLADGVGALIIDENSSASKCIEDFKEGAGEFVYALVKAVVEEGSGSWEMAGVPKYLLLDLELDWADYLRDVAKKVPV